ncbi:MAG: Asp-tRNA(Asn)/Glu-tRNA(Gln) amidotransferase subunit GatA [bacterium]|nr:Asp-tRNA(Asn)/Glu-tRNA(Gln) amidotransferase subunit GatA [bacterium]
MDELYTLDLHQALSLLEQGEISSLELTQSHLNRIEAVDGRIKAYITVGAEQALAQAKRADADRAQGRAGLLCGAPLGLKDLLCTTELPTTCGSKMLKHFVAPYNATVVEKLQAAGAVILGKQAMDEFAMGSTSEHCAFQIPENPWKAGHICGGSSGGSAAAVAAGECLASLGTDTGGSIRQPSSHCGVVGLKPTYGLVSRYGAIAFASSLDQIGPIAKNVRDSALMLEAIAGFDEKDSTSIRRLVPRYRDALGKDLTGMRIGIPSEYFSQALDSEVEREVRKALSTLENAGARLVEVSLPHTEYCVAVYYLIATAEASSNLARFDGIHFGYHDPDSTDLLDQYSRSRAVAFGDEVKRRILIGTYALSAGYYDAYYKKASQVRTLIRADFTRVFKDCDLIASPVSPHAAPAIGAMENNLVSMYLADILTISANLAGIPAMSVPCGFTSEGLPIGLQLQAAHFHEETLLQAAYAVEAQLGISTVKPVL